ncbi:MAG TPA: hypothetical protein VIS09_14545 [Streptomyces sp.]
MEQARLPRDAYFSATEDVPVEQAAGRIAAELITPYPRAFPWCCPASKLTDPVPRYLRTGLDAGMNLPDPADPALDTVRACANGDGV